MQSVSDALLGKHLCGCRNTLPNLEVQVRRRQKSLPCFLCRPRHKIKIMCLFGLVFLCLNLYFLFTTTQRMGNLHWGCLVSKIGLLAAFHVTVIFIVLSNLHKERFLCHRVVFVFGCWLFFLVGWLCGVCLFICLLNIFRNCHQISQEITWDII